MKTTLKMASLAASMILAALSAQAGGLSTTAFTYQGRLVDDGLAAVGSYAFVVRLTDEDGVQEFGTICEDVVPVTNGLFTLQLDFGLDVGAPSKFLEFRIEKNGNCADTSNFIELSSRQPITAAPSAVHALSANDAVQAESAGLAEHAGFADLASAARRLDAPDGSPVNAVFVDNGGNVGIGTTSPATKLHVKGAASEGVRIQGAADGAANLAWVAFHDLDGTAIGYVGDGGSEDSNTYLGSDVADVVLQPAGASALHAKAGGNVGIGMATPQTKLHVHGQSVWLTGGNGGGFPNSAGAGFRQYFDGNRAMLFAFDYASATPRPLALQEPGGDVGIGTTNPAARLDVRGNVKLGPSGEFFAASGQENLRIVRGTVNANGTLNRGTGFSVSGTSGDYLITFTTPFSASPSMTVAWEYGIGATPLFAAADNVGTATAGVVLQDGSGLVRAGPFHFIAVGPR